MFQRIALLCLGLALLAACLPIATLAPATQENMPATATCPITKPVRAQPPDDPNADPFGFGDWYINTDHTIWVGSPPVGSWQTGGEKVLWIRPAGTALAVTGQRLDAEAPPLRVEIPCCYPTGFQVTGLHFPTEGCWEVTATADEHELRFITQVARGDSSHSGAVEAAHQALAARADALQLLLVDQRDEKTLQVRPIDPLTLTDLPGYEPIPVGHHYTYALSPDQTRLALVSWSSGAGNTAGELTLVDLNDWVVHLTGVRFDSYIDPLLFSRDGQVLYWLAPGQHHPAHGLPRRFQLYHYSLAHGQLAASYEFADSFTPWAMELVNGGERLAVFGVPTDAENLAADVPSLYLLDLPDGVAATALRLEGVRAGQSHLEMGVGGDYPYAYDVPGLAWDEPGKRLYIADLATETLIVLNLADGIVEKQASLRPPLSWRQRLMRWLMPVAAAKLVPGTRVQAAIHPGTDRLYLSGSQLEVWPVDTGGYRWQEEALGLRVVDLEQLETLQHIKLALSNVVVTPNGRYAIVTGAPMQSSQRGQEAAKDEYGLYLFEADSLKLLSSVRFDGWFQIDEFVFDDFSYVQFGTELDSGKWITTLQVRALPSLAVVAERTLEDGYAALIGLGHPRP